jgi:hypothetical protein
MDRATASPWEKTATTMAVVEKEEKSPNLTNTQL